jgi:hypothetical protein
MDAIEFPRYRQPVVGRELSAMQLHMRCTSTVGVKCALNRLKRLAEYQPWLRHCYTWLVNGTAQLEYLPRISEKGGDSVGHLYYSYSIRADARGNRRVCRGMPLREVEEMS